jgi:CPA2 family monovalent cation:H+ antiporter-2
MPAVGAATSAALFGATGAEALEGVLVARTFVELGIVIIALALLARLAIRLRLSPIPFFLLSGLAFGTGGFVPLSLSEDFIAFGAQIGVILLLFMLGLEYTATELRAGLRNGWQAGFVDVALNFLPGLLAGLALGWGWLGGLLLAGVTYNTSSGVMAKLLGDLGRLGNRETPAVLTLSVMEDLTNTVYLPVMAVLLIGGTLAGALTSLAVALVTVAIVLVVALRYGEAVSRAVDSTSDEVVLLTTFGVVLLVAGVAQQLQVSAAIGAFLVGIALSGRVADRARALLGPLRDLFAATFFVFFGLQIDPGGLGPVAGVAVALAVVSSATKVATGWWAARRIGAATPGRFRAGTAMIPRGEFSIVIAGLGVTAGVEPLLGPLAAAYVLLCAVIAPVAARYVEPVVAWFTARRPQARR